MEALAEPGKAYLTEATAELAHGFFELEDLGEFEIKGASRPVRVFELAGVGAARSRLDLSRERGFSRFVGRDEEMAVLEAALERAKAGEGAVVGIVAEPGIGKSRLCHEFAERARADGIEVFEAQAQAHGREIPFMPVLQMLRSYFGIADGDAERIVREKIAGRALLLDPEFADELPLLFDFLGVPDPDRPLPQLSAEARQRALRGRRLPAGPRAQPPRADRHRDRGPALDGRGQRGHARRAVRLGRGHARRSSSSTSGPSTTPAWTGPPDYQRISLEPLGPADTEELLRDLAGEDPSLDGLAELIHERTAGNPFFIEEIVREPGREPATSRASAAPTGWRARSRTPACRPACRRCSPRGSTGSSPEAKRLLQVASVAGKEIGERALRSIAGRGDGGDARPPLRELIDAGFLYEAELYPERVLAFRHPLTREVAYGTQLAEQRAATHAAVGAGDDRAQPRPRTTSWRR